MYELQIGVAQLSLRIRHSQSLKDKRKVVQSLVQKLRNMGFSVTETGQQDNPKFGSIGFTFAGSSPAQVEERFRDVEKLLWGDFEVLEFSKDVLDYANLDDFNPPEEDEFSKD